MSKNKLTNIFWWSLILLIIFLVHPGNRLNADEGIILEGAWNLYNHQRLYYDFFNFISPGSFYLVLGIWKILGLSFWPVKIISALITFGSAIGIYLSARLIRPSRLNILAPLFFSLISSALLLINHNTYNLFFTIWSIYFIFLALEKRTIKYYILGGLMSGLAILFLQQRGLTLAGALILFMLVTDFRGLKNFLAYCLGTLAPLLLLLFWPLKILYYNLLVFPISTYLEVNKTSFMLLAVAFLFWAAIAYAFRKKNNKKIWLLLTVEFFLLLSTIPLPDFNHVITILSPSLALTAAIIEERRLKNTIGAKIINYCLTTVGTLLLLLVLWVFLTPNLHEPSFWQNPEWFKAEEWFKIIQQCPGDYIYAGPFLPNIYFEARKLNATPYPFLITRQNPPAQFEDAVRHLQARQPNCAILVYYGGLNRFHYCQDNPVENYIRQNYRLLYSDSNIFVYRR